MPQNAVTRALDALMVLDEMWGDARLGLALAAAFFNEKPLTTDQLAERCGISDETVRRRIKPLWNVNRVETVREGRNVRYVATRHWAERTVIVLEQVTKVGQNL